MLHLVAAFHGGKKVNQPTSTKMVQGQRSAGRGGESQGDPASAQGGEQVENPRLDGKPILFDACPDQGTSALQNLLDGKLAEYGLSMLVDRLLVSDQAAFLTALSRCACTPEYAVMVGDSLATDVDGALAAGLHAVWLNRVNAPVPDGLRARVLKSFEPGSCHSRDQR